MSRTRSLVLSIVAIVVLTAAALTATLGAGLSPQLGLDLQGGVSVVLEPRTKASESVLDQAILVIQSRVDALGVAEANISRQGSTIIVQLPGVKNKDRALALVGETAQLRVRPVIERGVAPSEAPTLSGEELSKATVVLPEKDKSGNVLGHYKLGPSMVGDQVIDGRILSTARATVEPTAGEWQVDLTFTSTGGRLFDDFARQVGAGNAFAFDLDGVVKSAPSLQTVDFGGKARITGTFSEREAKDLALVLRYGSLPVELQPQTVQTVSASLGKDSLHAGLVSGLVGIALVAAYMALYYRALGVVVWAGLVLTAAMLWALVSYLGRTWGLALTLSGVTGMIVSLGVTVDSYIVYFERLKDEIRAGRTLRSSVERGFGGAFRTIVAANASALIGAAVLYWLSVGSVRGFAFFLGLSTLLDLIVTYLFTRPVVALLGRSHLFTEARWLGVARRLGGGASA